MTDSKDENPNLADEASASETEAPTNDDAPPEAVTEAPEAAAADTDTGADAAPAEEAEETEAPAETAVAVADPPSANGGGGLDDYFFDDDPFGDDDMDVSREEFERLLTEHEDVIGEVKEGEIVNAKVLRVTENGVILEFGFKSEGSVPLEEFKDPESLSEGDELEVLLESLEDDDGVVVLSKKKADFLRVWEKIKEAHESDVPVRGTLTRKIKGGVTVDLMGVDAFLPGSQIALRRVPNIEDLLGSTFDFKIIKLNKRRRNIVVSRRVILESEREEKRDQLVKELIVGQVREGIVKNITDFGAFIDLGGLDGLLHITDMSWGRVGHPSEVVEIGSKLDVKILDIDWDRERISLGLKQLQPYPWAEIDKKYPVGTRVKGKVVSITNYGAFVELEKGVEGLVHISEMSWTRNIRHPSKLVSISDEIEAVVLKVDPEEEKISLGMKQTEEDPWLALPLKYPSGTRLKGTVRNLTSFGAFVEIEPGIDGLVHVSDMSWTRRIEHPSEVVDKGLEVEVMVLDVDAENKRISLGLKQLEDDPWPGIVERFAPGVEAEGKVLRVQEKGVVIDLGDNIDGFVPTSHTGLDEDVDLEEYFRVDDDADIRVLESDAANRRIVLELTSVPERRPKPEKPAEEEEPEEGEGEEASADSDAEAPEAAAEDAATEDESVEDEAPEEDDSDDASEDDAEESEPEAQADDAEGDEVEDADEGEDAGSAEEKESAEEEEDPEKEADA